MVLKDISSIFCVGENINMYEGDGKWEPDVPKFVSWMNISLVFFVRRSTVRIGEAWWWFGHWQARQIHYFPHIATPAKDRDIVQAKMKPSTWVKI